MHGRTPEEIAPPRRLLRAVARAEPILGREDDSTVPPTALTQIAPDGLTPFDPSDANMVGWAEEISLDVEWAHAIAPGARIVHLEFPGIDTGFYRFGGTSAGAPQGQYPMQDRRVVADVGNRALLAARQCRFLVGRSFIENAEATAGADRAETEHGAEVAARPEDDVTRPLPRRPSAGVFCRMTSDVMAPPTMRVILSR